MRLLFGYVLDWDGTQNSGTTFLEILTAEKVAEIRSNARTDERVGRRWQSFWLFSRRPLLGEEAGGLDVSPIYRYRLFVRVNSVTNSVILASPRYAITDAAVESVNRAISPDLRRRVLNVNELSQHLLARQAQHYAVTYLMADVTGHKPFINTLALYGDDIGAANFLLEERKAFIARQVGVRSIRGIVEFGRFGNTGSIQFQAELAEELEQFLSYTYKNNFYIA